jgi:hypothetical protein
MSVAAVGVATSIVGVAATLPDEDFFQGKFNAPRNGTVVIWRYPATVNTGTTTPPITHG